MRCVCVCKYRIYIKTSVCACVRECLRDNDKNSKMVWFPEKNVLCNHTARKGIKNRKIRFDKDLLCSFVAVVLYDACPSPPRRNMGPK